MSQSRIMDALGVAADAAADGRTAEWESILQDLEDDGAWAFDHWKSPPTVAEKIMSLVVEYYSDRYARPGFLELLRDSQTWAAFTRYGVGIVAHAPTIIDVA